MSNDVDKIIDEKITSTVTDANTVNKISECIQKKSESSKMKNNCTRKCVDNGIQILGNGSRNFRRNKFNDASRKRTWPQRQDDGKKKRRLEIGERLKEPEIGVTEFIGDHAGIFGIIKERYSDFHVNEISEDGELAKLTNQDVLTDNANPEDVDDLKKYVPDHIWDMLQPLKQTDVSNVLIEIDVTEMDKLQRKAIHLTVEEMADVNSQTITKDDRKIMHISPKKKKKNATEQFRPQRNNSVWMKRNGYYCHFILHKVNIDTIDALNKLSVKLRVNPNKFNYAGTKDRRAWTSQWVSLKKANPYDILEAARKIHGVYVGNFKFVKKPLTLGMLKGNRFRIALRSINGTDKQIENVMVSLRDKGFINYYGLQRFGSVAAIPTHKIGKTLLQGKWHEAIELILKPREGENDEDLIEARKIYNETKDARAAYQKVKRCGKIEAMLLRGLHVCGNNNPQGALDSIPRNVRLMYIHAYQSFIWNRVVSKRIKEFGIYPIVGDLVYEHSSGTEQFETSNIDDIIMANSDESSMQKDTNISTCNEKHSDEMKECKEETMEQQKVDVEEKTENVEENSEKQENSTLTTATDVEVTSKHNVEADLKTKSKPTADKGEQLELSNLPPVKILMEGDLPNYTLADIVMPQPGWKVTYPPYSKPWYDEFLAQDDLTTDLRQKNKKYSLGGAYRKILEIPSDLSWKVMHYKDKYDDLINCDINEMRNVKPPQDVPEGQNKALIVEMSLSSCAYATMALREILKFDTSPQEQAAQFIACNAEIKSEDVKLENVSLDIKSESCTVSITDNNEQKVEVKTKQEENNESITDIKEENEA